MDFGTGVVDSVVESSRGSPGNLSSANTMPTLNASRTTRISSVDTATSSQMVTLGESGLFPIP